MYNTATQCTTAENIRSIKHTKTNLSCSHVRLNKISLTKFELHKLKGCASYVYCRASVGLYAHFMAKRKGKNFWVKGNTLISRSA